MKLSSRAWIATAFVAVLVSGATPAWSQTAGEQRHPQGLFGGDSGGRQMLDFSLSLAHAHDGNTTDAPGDGDGLPVGGTLSSGYSTMLRGNARYRWQGSRVQIGAMGTSALRYFSQLEDIRSAGHTAGLGFTTRLTGRTMLFLNQTAAYSPSYLYGLFPRAAVSEPGETFVAAPDYAISDSHSSSYGTMLSLTQGLSRRMSVSAVGEYQYSDFRDQAGARRDMNTRGVRLGFSRNLSKNSAVRAGYHHRRGSIGEHGPDVEDRDGSTVEHGVDVGVNYSHPLSRTRRMHLAFNFGSSAVNAPGPLDAETGLARQYRLSGDVMVGCQFRTWHVRGMFRRGVEYAAELSKPVFLDGLTAETSILVNPRLDVVASARYSRGGLASGRDGLTFDSYGADVRVRYALTRALAVYGTYLYYVYDFRGHTQLAPGIPTTLERNGVRVGLTLWMPAVRR